MKTLQNIYTEWIAPVIRVNSVPTLSIRYVVPWIIALTWLLRLPKDPYVRFGYRIISLWQHNGPTFVVRYLKDCHNLVVQYVAGNPVYLVTTNVIGLSGGLPRIIPGSLRLLIKAGDAGTIRGVLSVLQMYRVIRIPVSLKLETITAPFSGSYPSIPSLEIKEALRLLGVPQFSLRTLRVTRVLPLTSSGPNARTSLFGLDWDCLAWSREPVLLAKLERFLSITGSYSFLDKVRSHIQVVEKYVSEMSKRFDFYEIDFSRACLGRLSIKEEPAGKARVFAITDSVTQSVLKPLHDALFRFLGTLETDGTFNQDRPIRVLLDRMSGVDGVKFFSYDLSAATDRLPVRLQRDILSLLVSSEYAQLWSDLLVERQWYLKDHGSLRYAVGQPMGALSSWGMLALTHHVVVQVAASRVGFDKLFLDYAILGDDIVIANELVAKSYHSLMTKWLGVEINLSKSLISTHMLEFAKRLVSFKGEYTPVGAKNLSLALCTPKGIVSLVYDIANKGVVFTDREYQKMISKLPFRYGRKVKDFLLWSIQGPFGFVPTESGLSSVYPANNSLSPVQISSLIYAIQKAKYLISLRRWENSVKSTVDLVVRFGYDGTYRWPGVPVGPLYDDVREQYRDRLSRLFLEKPVFRLLYNGPLIITDYTRVGYGKEIGDYIRSLIFDPSYIDPFVNDPFTDAAILPFRMLPKSHTFFDVVRTIDREAARERMEVLRELWADEEDD